MRPLQRTPPPTLKEHTSGKRRPPDRGSFRSIGSMNTRTPDEEESNFEKEALKILVELNPQWMEGKSYLESREDMTRVYNDWRNTANAKTNDFEVRWDIKELAQERPWPSPDGSMSSRSDEGSVTSSLSLPRSDVSVLNKEESDTAFFRTSEVSHTNALNAGTHVSRSSIIAATNETEAVAGNPAESEAITPRASNMAQYTPAYPENLEDFETATQFAVEPTPHASQGRFMTNHEIMSEIRAAYEHGLMENEDELIALRTEVETFQRQKEQFAADKAAFDAERRRVQKEHNAWELNRKVAQILPTKKERLEVELLKEQIVSLQKRHRTKELEHSRTENRYQSRINDLAQQLSECQAEVQVLTRQRASWLERTSPSLPPVRRAQPTQIRIPLPCRSPMAVQVQGSRLPRASPQSRRVPAITIASACTTERRRLTLSPRPKHSSDEVLDRIASELGFGRDFQTHTDEDQKVTRTWKADDSCVSLTWYPNGSVRQLSEPSGVKVVYYTSGDRQVFTRNGEATYLHADGTERVKEADGSTICKFSNGQVERHYPNGTREIFYSGGNITYMFADGTEKTTYPDGRTSTLDIDGVRTTEMPGGGTEIVGGGVRTRHYADGAYKKTFSDGRIEKRYANGHVRIRNRQGEVELDLPPDLASATGTAAPAAYA